MRLVIPDLQPGTQYAIQVRADDGSSQSEWSAIYDLITLDDTVTPTTPTNVTWVSNGDNFHAEWTAVTTNTDGETIPITRYEVELTSGAIVKVDSVPPATGASKVTYDLSFEANRVLFGTAKASIDFRVRAVDNKDLKSPWTSVINAQNSPPTPASNVVINTGVDSLDISWTASPDTDVAGYNVYVGTTAGFTPSAGNKVFSGNATRFTYTSTTYSTQHFKVRAFDRFGQESTDVSGSGTPTSPYVVDTAAPAVPTALAGTITNNANGIGATANVTWTMSSPPSDLAGFYLRYRKVGAGDYSYASFDKDARAGVVNLNESYTNYEFQIRAYDWSNNNSAFSATTTVTAPTNALPANVTGLSATAGKDSITYSWNAVADSDLKGYELVVSKSSTFASDNTTLPTGPNPNQTIAGLDPATTYYARVRAVDTQGAVSNAWSSTNTTSTTAFPTTPLSDGNVPASSPTPTVTAGIGNLFASWTPVTNADLVTYEVHVSVTDNFTPNAGTKAGETMGTFVTLENTAGGTPLAYGTTYYVKLIAKDRDGSAAAGSQGSGTPSKVGSTDSTLTASDVGAPTTGQFNTLTGTVNTSIKSSVNEYAVNSSETVAPSSGWSTSTPTRTPGTFIWFRTVVTKNDNSTSTTNPALLTGNAGATGSAGVGIASTAVTYQVGNSATVAPTGTWTSSIPATTPGTYLWTRTITTYTDTTTSGPAYSVSAHGATGSNGTNGVGVSGTAVTYQVHSNGTTAPTGTWQSTPQTTTTGQFLWTRTITTYTDSSTSTAYSVAAHGATGSQGNAGVSVTGITPFFAQVSTGSTPTQPASGTATPSAPWQTTEPTYVGGTELWRTERITYSSGTSPIYTTQSKVSSYAAAVAAQATADGKNKIYHSTGTPGTTANVAGDTWYQIDNTTDNRIIAQWRGTGGTSWVSETIRSEVIAYLSASKIQANSTFTNDLSVKSTFTLGDAGTPGVIKSYDYVAGSAGFSLSSAGLEIRQGTVAANTLVSGTGIVNNLVVQTGGGVQSSNYSAGTQGFRLSEAGLEVNSAGSSIRADAIKAGTLGGTTSGAGVIDVGAGTSLRMNGGHLRSVTYTYPGQSGGVYAYNAGATAGFYLGNDGLVIATGAIKAEAFAGGTMSTATINLSGTATIQTTGYNGSAGFRLSASGLEIPNGSITAAKVNIQNSQNLMRPEYADFEGNAGLYAKMPKFSSTVSISTTDAKFNKQSLKWVGNSSFNTVNMAYYYLDENDNEIIDYNLELTPGAVYIVSYYAMAKTGDTSMNVAPFLKNLLANGTVFNVAGTAVTPAANSTWARYTSTITVPASSSGKALLYFFSNNAGTVYLDGIQIEEKAAGNISNVASSWTPPGISTIDGASIKTGEIRSNNYAPEDASKPMWAIAMDGTASFSSMRIYGNTVLGNAEDTSDETTYLASANFVAGAAGWRVSSTGKAEFRDLVASSISPTALDSGELNEDTTIVLRGAIEAYGPNGEIVGMSAAGFYSIGMDANGQATPFVEFPTDGGKPNIISGVLDATTLNVNGNADGISGTISGAMILNNRGTITLASIVSLPSNAPVIKVDWENYPAAIPAGYTLAGWTVGHDGHLYTQMYATAAGPNIFGSPSTFAKHYIRKYNSSTSVPISNTLVKEDQIVGYTSTEFRRTMSRTANGIAYIPNFLNGTSGAYIIAVREWGSTTYTRTNTTTTKDVYYFMVFDTSFNFITSAAVFDPRGNRDTLTIGRDYTDGTKLMVGWRSTTNSQHIVRRYTHTTAGGAVQSGGDVGVGTEMGGAGIVGYGPFDTGVNKYLWFNNNAGTRQASFYSGTTPTTPVGVDNFYLAENQPHYGLTWNTNTGKFDGYATNGKRYIYQGGSNTWNTGAISAVWQFKYSWWDSTGTNYETARGPATAAVTMYKRARISISTQRIPYNSGLDESPNRARIYRSVDSGAYGYFTYIEQPGVTYSLASQTLSNSGAEGSGGTAFPVTDTPGKILGTNLEISGDGGVKTNNPSMALRTGTLFNLPASGNFYKVGLGLDPRYTSRGNVTTGASSIKILVAGWYYVSAGVSWGGTATTGRRFMGVLRSDTDYATASNITANWQAINILCETGDSYVGNLRQSASTTVYLNVGDYLCLAVYSDVVNAALPAVSDTTGNGYQYLRATMIA